jgi:NAD-dependent SIR2 family protein deacetylase
LAADRHLTLSLDALVRSVSLRRSEPHAVFLGAGASITSGIPSAQSCIWEWKRRIFITNNPGLEAQFRDTSLPSVRERIQAWLDHAGHYPKLGTAEEYGFYVEKCYPIPDDRRAYFEELRAGVEPFVGYRGLALLARHDVIKEVWTTNFDSLGARAAMADGIAVLEAGLDSTHRVRRPSAGELLHVALHGDYRYDQLKNTKEETREQDAALRAALVEHCRDTNLIVCGYSGRDASVMETMREAYRQPGPGRVYWCGYDDDVPTHVRELLELAAWAGRDAFYVPSRGFDDLIVRIALATLTGAGQEQAKQLFALTHAGAEPEPFAIELTKVVDLIKSNAFPLEPPSEVLSFEPKQFGEHRWRTLREKIRGTNVVAVPQGGKVLALGTVDDVNRLFATQIKSEVERVPIVPKELARDDGAVVSLLLSALTRAFAQAHDLETDGARVLWSKAVLQRAHVNGTPYLVHDAVLLFLRRYSGKQFLVLKPTIKTFTTSGAPAELDIDRELKRQVLGKQWNGKFNAALMRWRAVLLPKDAHRVEFPAGAGSTFHFNLSRLPAFAKLGGTNGAPTIKLPPAVAHSSLYDGIRLNEPDLVFAAKRAEGFVRDPHPVRGLLENRPYDFSLTERGFAPTVRVGIVAPVAEAPRLATYLARLHHSVQPDSKQEYLLPYPGFAQTFGLPLDLPQRGHDGWVDLPEPFLEQSIEQGAATLGQLIRSAIDRLAATTAPSVVVVFVPARWKRWEKYRGFDLHDFVKAYCVQRGIATQFLREETLTKKYQGEIVWWLALELYVKSMRTPWILDRSDGETAYVGLGFSPISGGPREKQIVLGCSHLYSSTGEGMTYRLSKLENPLIRNRNPYMRRDDARRVAENARQLFYEWQGKLPSRVVFQKRTPFMPEERAGLLDGLEGIDDVEMLEITVDPALRYIASRMRYGKLEDDPFPVRRGAAVVLDRRRALVWVHGAAAGLGGKTYYQGKSRIPAPLIITRHHGSAPFKTVAEEILGLSKMDWNSFDLYSKHPATIESSNAIARIGALLERFGPVSYDYRLFI